MTCHVSSHALSPSTAGHRRHGQCVASRLIQLQKSRWVPRWVQVPLSIASKNLIGDNS